MHPEIEIKIELMPVVKQDIGTGLFVAHFDQFPRAIAEGKTKEEAENGLTEIFNIMLKENQQEIIGQIVKRYKRVTRSKERFEKVKDIKVYS